MSNTYHWDIPSPLTALSIEERLEERGEALSIGISGTKLRSGPAADARLLAYLDGARREDRHIELDLAYKLHSTDESAQGWLEVIHNPTIHLLAYYANSIRDYDAFNVASEVREKQRAHRGPDGVVTSTGGQNFVFDTNALLSSGRSASIFSAQPIIELRRSLNSLAISRGTKGLEPTIVSFLAELVENVRDHALIDAEGGTRGACFLQLKRTNSTQLASVLEMLPERSPFRDYIGQLGARWGSKLLGVLEVTISDTGPGIASSISGTRPDLLSADEELSWIVRALQKHVSRKPGSGRGLGFSKVLESVKNVNGAIQIRTGRWSLFQNRLGDDWSQIDLSADRAWTTSRLSFASGTSVTLLFPATGE